MGKKGKKKKSTPLDLAPPTSNDGIAFHTSRDLGRFVAASRSVKAGEVVLAESLEFGFVLFGDGHCPVCSAATSSTSCGAACEEKGRAVAEVESRVVDRVESICEKTSVDVHLFRLVLRLLANRVVQLQQVQPSLWDDLIVPLVTNLDVMDQAWVRSVNDAFVHLVSALNPNHILLLATSCGEGETGTPEQRVVRLAVDLAAKVNSNAYGLSLVDVDGTSKVAGVALLPYCGIFQHDCNPNCTYVWVPGQGMQVRALRNLSQGEKLSLCYVDLLLGRSERRSLLKRTKHFDCMCGRCSSRPPADEFLDGFVAFRYDPANKLAHPTVEDITKSENILVHVNNEADDEVHKVVEAKLIELYGEQAFRSNKLPSEFYFCTSTGDIFSKGFLDQQRAKLQRILDRASKLVDQGLHADADRVIDEEFLAVYEPRSFVRHAAKETNEATQKTHTKLLVHPRNSLVLNAYLLKSNVNKRTGNLDAARDAMLTVLDISAGVLPSNYPELAELHRNIAQVTNKQLSDVGNLTEAARRELEATMKRHIEDCVVMAKICYGGDHVATKSAEKLRAEILKV